MTATNGEETTNRTSTSGSQAASGNPALQLVVRVIAWIIPARWLYRFVQKYASPEQVAQLASDVDPGMADTWWPPAFLEPK